MDLLCELKKQIELGDNLYANAKRDLSHIQGFQKFETKINADLKFLRPLVDNPSKIKAQHLVSSNLRSLDSIYKLAIEHKDLTKIFYNSKIESGEKVQIDIVTETKWIKACSRKARALIQKWFVIKLKILFYNFWKFSFTNEREIVIFQLR
jgi:hypothetical protein